jgi:enamine deaminase RidA (YjgF/YER057c/UK114 family)
LFPSTNVRPSSCLVILTSGKSGFVNSSPNFTEQPKVINAASDLLVEIFGDMAKHSRIAVGVASLPLNSTVEIDMVVEFST